MYLCDSNCSFWKVSVLQTYVASHDFYKLSKCRYCGGREQHSKSQGGQCLGQNPESQQGFYYYVFFFFLHLHELLLLIYWITYFSLTKSLITLDEIDDSLWRLIQVANLSHWFTTFLKHVGVQVTEKRDEGQGGQTGHTSCLLYPTGRRCTNTSQSR